MHKMKIFLAIILAIVFSTFAIAQEKGRLKYNVSSSEQAGNVLGRINPLILLIEIDGDESIKLNTQNAGSLKNSATVINKLKSVVEQRQKARIFHEGTTEVEAAAKLRINGDVSYSDIVSLVAKLEEIKAIPLTIVIGETEIPVSYSAAPDDEILTIEVFTNGVYSVGGQKVTGEILKRKLKSAEDKYFFVEAKPDIKFAGVENLLSVVISN